MDKQHTQIRAVRAEFGQIGPVIAEHFINLGETISAYGPGFVLALRTNQPVPRCEKCGAWCNQGFAMIADIITCGLHVAPWHLTAVNLSLDFLQREWLEGQN